MNEIEALRRMVAPGTERRGKMLQGITQIMLTRACNLSCYNCTQGSNLAGKPVMMSPEEFETACKSLKGYTRVIGLFGGNPAIHPRFPEICEIFCQYFPFEQRGLWSNNLNGHGAICRKTFAAHHSNLNVHMDKVAYDEMWATWPEARRFIKGLTSDSRHSPPFVAMQDLDTLPANPGNDKVWLTRMPNTEENRWKLISDCDINKHWSALVGIVPGKGLRGFFCEIAYAQAALHADDPSWPDVGTLIDSDGMSELGNGKKGYWWQQPMEFFKEQVKYHCHRCSVPLKGFGELACNPDGTEQVSATHQGIYKPKDKGRKVELVTDLVQLNVGKLKLMVKYIENSQIK